MSLRHAAVPGAAAIPRQAPPPLAARRRMVAAQQSSGRASAASTLEHQVTEDSAPAMNTRVDDQYKSFLDNWDRGFVDTEEEPEGYWMEAEFGQIPMDLHGTLFRNGPGKFQIGSDKVGHPYDGDGLVLAISFNNGSAFFRSRFVRTAEYLAESKEQRIMFRGTFGTQRPGGPAQNALDVVVKNTSNTNVVCWGGRLWTLFEAGQPYRLDPSSLETEGLETLDGQLRAGLPFDMGSAGANEAFGSMISGTQQRLGNGPYMPRELLAAGGDAMTAHPHVDSNTGHLVSFSYQVGPQLFPPSLKTALTFWEFTPEFEVAAKTSFELDGFAFLHDFAITKNFFVVFQNPVTVDNVPYVLGKAPAAACVRWVAGKPTLLHLIPRPGRTDAQGLPLQPRTFTAPSLFVFHHANAYESEDGQRIVVDSIHYESLPAVGREALAEQQIDPDVAFRSRLRRVEIDLRTGMLQIRKQFDQYLEMCSINEARSGRQHRFVFGYNSVFQPDNDVQIGIAKVDTVTGTAALWRPGYQKFALEPKFVGRPGATKEDDGWLLTVMFDSGTQDCHLVILDAQHLEAGPVASLKFRDPVPSGLHGCWSSTYYGPDAAPAQ